MKPLGRTATLRICFSRPLGLSSPFRAVARPARSLGTADRRSKHEPHSRTFYQISIPLRISCRQPRCRVPYRAFDCWPIDPGTPCHPSTRICQILIFGFLPIVLYIYFRQPTGTCPSRASARFDKSLRTLSRLSMSQFHSRVVCHPATNPSTSSRWEKCRLRTRCTYPLAILHRRLRRLRGPICLFHWPYQPSILPRTWPRQARSTCRSLL